MKNTMLNVQGGRHNKRWAGRQTRSFVAFLVLFMSWRPCNCFRREVLKCREDRQTAGQADRQADDFKLSNLSPMTQVLPSRESFCTGSV